MVELSREEKKKLCLELTEHLPKIRKLLNLTQAEFGDMTGLSRVTISQIEGGKVKLTWKAVRNARTYTVYRSTTKDGAYDR